MGFANAVKELQLTDSGKLLFMFEGAKKAGVEMNEGEVDGMAFLLNARRALPFGYPFLLNPLPVSSELRQDLYNLLETGYLERGSPIYITRQGSEWVSELLRKLDGHVELFKELEEILLTLIAEYRKQAFQLVYAAISG